MNALMNGTVVISSPTNPDEISRSASVISHHGTTISMTANANTQGHARQACLRAPDLAAIGNNTAAPMATLSQTTLAVEKWSTAIAMKKYGIPQANPAARNKKRPLRDTCQWYSGSFRNKHVLEGSVIIKPAETHPESAPLNPAIANRWSPRAFNAEHKLSRPELLSLLEAARWAPSANNGQPWRYFVVQRGDTHFDALASRGLSGFNQAWAPQASALIVVAIETKKEDGSDRNLAESHYDAGLSAAQLVLQASTLGLHTHQMSGIIRPEIASVLELAADLHVIAVIAVGQQADVEALPEGVAREREIQPRVRLDLHQIAPGL